MSSDFQPRLIPKPPLSAEAAYELRRQRRQRQVSHNAAFPITVEMIADRDNLFEAFRKLLQVKAETSGGEDGIRIADVSPQEFGTMLPELSRSIINGTYRPQPFRHVPIPKADPSQFRRLSIANILDRVVGFAVNEAISPYWETIFLDCSWGWRPGRSTWGMLRALEQMVESQQKFVLAIDDIKTAFDQVPIEPTLQVHRKMLDGIANTGGKGADAAATREKQKLIQLVSLLLRGPDAQRTRGIPQGGNYSPTALNALLHFHLDVPVRKLIGPLWYRYADNLCAVVESVSAGQQVLDNLRQKLHPLGLTLKGADGVYDLRKSAAPLLGFRISWGSGRMSFGLGDGAWTRLQENLQGAWKTEDPPSTARTSLEGWIRSYGPACVNDGICSLRILDCAAENGFREIARSEVARWVRQGAQRWCRYSLSGSTQVERGDG